MRRSLNLDSMFVPVPSPEIEFEMFQFPGGEWHIKLNPRIDYGIITKVIITSRFRTMDDLMKVAIAKDALERVGVTSFDLVMPYIPYARQDRVCEKYESFTLKTFTKLLNSLEFENVHVMDPHSDVAPALIENCRISSNVELVARALVDINDLCWLIVPDAGARKKAEKLAKSLNFMGLIQCDKIRDTKTGKLSGFEVAPNKIDEEPCIIVDDICDGGGTFLGLAEKLQYHGAGDIYLFVTHGIFSKGAPALKKYFKRVYTTNSFRTVKEDPFLIQYPIEL